MNEELEDSFLSSSYLLTFLFTEKKSGADCNPTFVLYAVVISMNT
jgi:hypothetical protein